MDFRGSLAVEAGQQAVQRSGAARLARGQPVAQRLVAGRAFEQAVEQRPQVKSGAAGDDRQAAARGDFGDGLARQPGIFAGGEELVGVDDIDQVVGNAAAFLERELGGADVEVAEDLEGVAVDDLAVEFLSNRKGQIALSGTGGPDDRNQWAIRARQRLQVRVRPVSVHSLMDTDLARPRYTMKRSFDPSGGLSGGRKKENSMIRLAKALLCVFPWAALLLAQTPQPPTPAANRAG